jgi:hypothetical protein
LSKLASINYDIHGFHSVHILENKSLNTTRGRTCEGISFYYTDKISKYVSILDKNQFGYIWVKLDRCLFDFNEDVFICHTYTRITSSTSKVINRDQFDFFENIEINI